MTEEKERRLLADSIFEWIRDRLLKLTDEQVAYQSISKLSKSGLSGLFGKKKEESPIEFETQKEEKKEKKESDSDSEDSDGNAKQIKTLPNYVPQAKKRETSTYEPLE